MKKNSHRPQAIKVTDDGRIVYNWQRFSGLVILLLMFDLLIIWVLSSGIKKDIELGNLDFSGGPLVTLICLSPVLVLSYFILGRFLNRTEFWVDGNELFVQYGPLPWLGNRAIPLTDIEGFTIEVTSVRGPRFYHLMADVQGKPRSKSFPMLSRMFVDLTNDTREDVVLALYQELMVRTGKHNS